jgi:hypothetical protein
MTVVVEGTLLQGLLVPSEVSATFLDDSLLKYAQSAVTEMESSSEASKEGHGSGNVHVEIDPPALHQARGFLRRFTRRPFSSSQARVRERNANALVALNDWHRTRDRNLRITSLDIQGSYADPTSIARDVVAYTAGQRALTLANVKMRVDSEWLALSAPVRVNIGLIGAWTLDI